MIRFIPFQTSGLFLPDAQSPGGAGFFAFLLPQPPSPLPAEITINQSWNQYQGFYLFLRTNPGTENLPNLVSQLQTWIQANAPGITHTSFAWVEYNAETQQLGTITLVRLEPGDNKPQLAADMQFDFRNYSLPLKKLAPVPHYTDEEENITAFTFEYPPYPGAPAPRQELNIQLPLTGNGRGAIFGQVSLGDLSANAATGWNASLYYVIHYEEQDIIQQYPIFNTQDAGLQILFNYQLDPLDPQNPNRSYLAFTGQTFLLKKDEAGNWTVSNLTGAQLPSFFRTIYGKHIDLVPVTTGDRPAKLVFEALPPKDGKPRYYLAPDGDFELILADINEQAAAQLLAGLSGTENFSFTGKTDLRPGDIMRFQSGQPAYAPKFPVLNTDTGSSTATPQSLARTRAALARQLEQHLLNPGNAAAGANAASNLLQSDWRTSWINIRPNSAAGLLKKKPGLGVPLTAEHLEDIETWEDWEEVMQNEALLRRAGAATYPVYFSQPNDAALYDNQGVSIDVNNKMLQLRDTPAAYFTAQVNQSVPMAPYAGVQAAEGFGFEEIRQFELQILTPSRRNAVSGISMEAQQPAVPNAAATETYINTTTPQGLLATVPANGLNWQTVLLAKSESKGITYNLSFVNGVTRELRDAMQSNQLFMVATEAAPLGDFRKKITIADWPFTINTGKGSDKGDFSNVLIFKFAAGSLEDRLKDPQSWSGASTFNNNPALVAGWISNYIEEAKLNAENEPRYKNFVEIVQNPAWNGILALKVDIGVESFPDDLKGLLAGIDQSQFFAHHFGIEVNFIEPDENGQLTLPRSSLFGLINYVDRGYRSGQDVLDHLAGENFIFNLQEVSSPFNSSAPQALYDFRVLTLQVVFGNSDILDFTSRIQITTTQWFSEPATLNTNRAGNSINTQSVDLNGSYESHNGVRTYTFVTDPGQTYRFFLQSQTMNYVEIVKAQFNTLNIPEDQAQAGSPIEKIFSRFTFWGYMNFKLITGFDVFSFGDSSAQLSSEPRGLYFASLCVNMNFDLNNETGLATNRVFQFDTSTISFDISLSTPRPGSLFTNFAVRLSGLAGGEGEKNKPSSQGFLPVIVQSPESLGLQSLTSSWYSLVFDLNLGSMGALAAKAGFVAQLNAAWSPDTRVRRMAMGMRLPGVGGGQKTLSLQSVLNVNIQSITLISEYADAEKKNLAYLLKFNNIKLSILGKKLPGAADTLFMLFGDPDGADKTSLAWYAAYYPKKPTVAMIDSPNSDQQ